MARIGPLIERGLTLWGTHALPTSLSIPPPDWRTPFPALAEECGLQTDIAAVFDNNVREFLENVLVGGMEQ